MGRKQTSSWQSACMWSVVVYWVDLLFAVELGKFSNANLAAVIHGGVVAGQHAVHQRSSLQPNARLVCSTSAVGTVIASF